MAPITWLDKLEQELNVDIDWMDPGFIQELLPSIRFHDQTSNQAFVDVQLDHPSSTALLRETAREVRDAAAGAGGDATTTPSVDLWLAIYTRTAVRLCKKNIDSISGRVLLQTSPSQAYDTEATLRHARLYDTEFRQAGIGRDRFCIKIPSTGPALNAAKILQEEGIQTLGTALFNVPQAMACSQARCLSISPYFNDVRVHDDRSLWPKVEDPAINHPNSPRIVQILELYRRLYKETGQDQPLVKGASFVSPEEILAAAEMGCHAATIFHQHVQEMAALSYDVASRPGGIAGEGITPKPTHAYRDAPPLSARLQPLMNIDPLRDGEDKTPKDDYATVTKIDYLADGGKALDVAVAADPAARDRLAAALALFVEAEHRSKDKVEKALAAL